MSDPQPKPSKDLTRSVHDPQEGDPELDPVYKRTRKRVMRFGTLAFTVISLALFVPMLVGVGLGISRDRIWDPHSGHPVSADSEGHVDCLAQGQRLMLEAGQLKKLTAAWQDPYREWRQVCKVEHPDLYEILARTREELRKKTIPEPPPEDQEP